ncbi:hypothetical protein ATEIFO6365_0007019200 [Aspergillus terreus]|uniref:Uncharacterized protein n=1 Tax=Aspergillus terreus TaxID=33178 RepID=A0A5M3Z4H2_ASPTE|nr:hypothetical protein ATETN484_0009019200 [Aspergillus terreus]GFF17643.1 hypothetical protein ATEIFO6365_0007019200 [Aspergillus terreus]
MSEQGDNTQSFDEPRASRVILPEYTNVKLTMGIPQKSGPPNEWKPRDRLSKLINEEEATVMHEGSVNFEINEAPVKRQVNALVKVQSNENGTLLYGIDHSVVNAALARLLRLRNWNAQQKAGFRSLRCTKGGCAILEGFLGCGKTSVLAATAIFLYNCGFNVLLVGASAQFGELTASDPIQYVRIRGEVEKRARTSANPLEPSAVEEASLEHEKRIALIGLLQALKLSLSRRAEGSPEYSLLTHVMRKCIEPATNGGVDWRSTNYTQAFGRIRWIG